ncbi:hypothetical protein EXU85_05205 [Spirosoma sp. KCTC 42546]|uniref:hypothetical protein n=1 Tax=Spirosoma sp. KCTC 42546 TaxID=2520506 RepID=UPI00115856F6|nr:hypothetical protein [Spirosoma sp. KCTC 42546]QDK78019.1 hypothetical protein EXU85_05205 [Spirosoma sp. KCTC 42546]
MNNNVNVTTKSSKLINWLTVWGFIFSVIAYNLYVDNRLNRDWYRTQYKAESQRADSLYTEKVRLEKRLRQIEEAREEGISAR